MKPRSLLVLAVVALAALALALVLAGQRNPATQPPAAGKLFPGLAKNLDAATRVRIAGAGNATLATLEKTDAGWGLVEKNGYRVDVARLRDLLDALANATLIEAKTANPTLHSRLGVEDVAQADARGALVEITTPDATHAVIVGDNAGQGSGTYVRRADEPQSWLIGGDIAVEKTPAEWLDKAIIDIAARDVTGVEVIPAKGVPVKITRVENETAADFSLLDIPKGREPAEGYTRDALAGALSMLRFDDVFSTDAEMAAQPAPEAMQRTTFTLADGRSVEVQSWDKDGKFMSRFSMALNEAAARAALQRHAVAKDDAAGDATTENPANAGLDVDAELAKLHELTDAFTRTHADWVYVLPAYKASNLRKGFDEYLKPKS